jgi:hypothetical protein
MNQWKSIFINFVRVLRNIQKNDSPLNQSYTEFNSHIRYFILALRVRPLKSISYEK